MHYSCKLAHCSYKAKILVYVISSIYVNNKQTKLFQNLTVEI